MAVLSAVVAVLAVATVVNLLLTLGLARRMAAHGSASGGSDRRPADVPAQGLPDDAPVPAFRSVTLDGAVLDSADLAGPTLFGFFSVTCKPCAAHLPHFVEQARSFAGGAESVVAVVMGVGPEADRFVAELEPVARIVREQTKEQAGTTGLSKAFNINLLPGYVLVDADRRVQTRMALTELPLPVRS